MVNHPATKNKLNHFRLLGTQSLVQVAQTLWIKWAYDGYDNTVS